MTLQWDESLAVGHPLIDAQHLGLFEHFGGFLAACEEGRGLVHLRATFGFLDDYIRFHFREEEALMERHSYPEAPQHRAEHRMFREKIEDLRKEMENSGATVQVLVRTNKALIYWLTEHIRDVDTRLAAFLRQGDEKQAQ